MNNGHDSAGRRVAGAGRIEILFLDEALLAINKPSGLPTLPDGYHPDAPHVKSLLEPGYGRLWVVHRLDRDTSGVLVLARNAAAHRALNQQFDRRLISKIYHALAAGQPDWQERRVDLRLRPDGDRQHRTVVDPRHGKPAVTDFAVLERFQGHVLLACQPHTGRTHQIRSHLAALDLPILGDALYGGASLSQFKPDNADGSHPGLPLIQRAALHALSLTLAHPASGENLTLNAPYPEDFDRALHTLRSRAI